MYEGIKANENCSQVAMEDSREAGKNVTNRSLAEIMPRGIDELLEAAQTLSPDDHKAIKSGSPDHREDCTFTKILQLKQNNIKALRTLYTSGGAHLYPLELCLYYEIPLFII